MDKADILFMSTWATVLSNNWPEDAPQKQCTVCAIKEPPSPACSFLVVPSLRPRRSTATMPSGACWPRGNPNCPISEPSRPPSLLPSPSPQGNVLIRERAAREPGSAEKGGATHSHPAPEFQEFRTVTFHPPHSHVRRKRVGPSRRWHVSGVELPAAAHSGRVQDRVCGVAAPGNLRVPLAVLQQIRQLMRFIFLFLFFIFYVDQRPRASPPTATPRRRHFARPRGSPTVKHT